MKYFLMVLIFLLFAACSVEDEMCVDSMDCPDGMKCNVETGNCEEIQGDTGNSGNTGDTGDTGDTGNSGNSGNSGDSGNSGNSGDSGNTGDSGDSGNTGDTGNTGTDHTSPVIVSVSPAENEKGVALDKPLEITFSEALNCSTVTAEGVVSIDDASITVTCNDDDPVVTFTRVWDSDSRYKVTVKGAVIKDKAGNTMDQSKNWYFETVDLTTPFVVKEESRPVGQSVRTDKVVRIVFSEPVKPETVKISLNSAEVTETPVVTDDDTVFEWSPVLELNTEYTVKVLDGVEDTAGNLMKTGDGHEWSFKTSAYNIYPVVNFYKVLIPLTKEPLCDNTANAFNNSSNFEVIDKSTTLAVTGVITCDTGAKTVKFVPATQFAKDGEYTIKIKSNVQYSDSSTIGAVDLIMDFHFEMIIDDNFENGSAGWEMENNWEIGVPNYNAFGYKINTAYSGTKVMATGLMDDHLVDTSYSTTGKNTFEIKEYDQFYIEFRAYVGLDDYGNKNNGMDVKIIEDGVVKVESVLLNLPNGEDLFGVYYLGTVAQSYPGIRGKSVNNTYSLFEGAVQGAVSTPGKKFSLSFVLNSDYDYAKAGVYLDDVKLYKTVF